MPDRQAKTLIRVGLIEPRHRRALLPIAEHIDTYEKVVAARRDNRASHAKATASCLNRVKRALNLQVYDDLNETDLLSWLGERGYTPATVRHYLQAWCGFCKWMVREHRAQQNPLESVHKPAPTPQFDRRPLEVPEVKKLLAYLSSPQADAGYRPRTWYNHKVRRMI